MKFFYCKEQYYCKSCHEIEALSKYVVDTHEGLAIRIIERKVSRLLYNKRVISLDLASVVAGTKYRGQ